MLRRANIHDLPTIVELAVESVSINPIPVRIDRQAMYDTAKEALNNPHFLWVNEEDGKVVGALVALCAPGFWFERNQVSVYLYYGKGVLKLFKKFMEWVQGRPAIKIVVVELEPETDPRLTKYLKKLGLIRESVNLTWVRGLNHE